MKLNGIDQELAVSAKCQTNGAVRIAAAAKRLKLGVLPKETQYGVRRPKTAGASIGDVIGDDDDSAWATRSVRSLDSDSQQRRLRPATSVGVAPRSFSRTNGLRPKTAPGHKVSEPKTTDLDDIIRKETTSNTATRSRQRRFSAYSSSSFGEEMRKTKALEKRHELLEDIAVQQEEARGKCEQFMLKADRWVQENPSISYHLERTDSRGSDQGGGDHTSRSLFKSAGEERLEHGRQLARRRNSKPTNSEQAWKDLNKCRYLRMDDEKIDLSGVNTLAIDQFNMMKSFKLSHNYTPLTPKVDFD